MVGVVCVFSYCFSLATGSCHMMNLQISRDLIIDSYLLSVGRFGTLSSKCLACVKDLVKVSDNLYIVVVVVDIYLWTTVKFVVVC